MNPMLYMVMLFNVRDRSFSVLDHNLSLEAAREDAKRQRMDQLPAFYLETGMVRHTGTAENCQKCAARVHAKMRAVEQSTKNAKRGRLDV